MSIDFLDPIVDMFAGVIGGSTVGAAAKGLGAGGANYTLAGAVGGLAGGLLLEGAIPFLSNQTGDPDARELIGEFVAGGLSGMVVAAIFGLIMNSLTKV